MFDRLAAYRDEHGHPNVPVKYPADPQLGSWVSGLRAKKKAYSGVGGGAGGFKDKELRPELTHPPPIKCEHVLNMV